MYLQLPGRDPLVPRVSVPVKEEDPSPEPREADTAEPAKDTQPGGARARCHRDTNTALRTVRRASHQGEAMATRWTPAGPQTESLGSASLVLGPSRGFSDQRGHQEGCESGGGSLDTHSGSRLSLYNLLGGSRPLLWDRAERGITEGAAPSDGGRLRPFPSAAGGSPRLPRCSLFAGRVEGRRGASQSHAGTPARPVSPRALPRWQGGSRSSEGTAPPPAAPLGGQHGAHPDSTPRHPLQYER